MSVHCLCIKADVPATDLAVKQLLFDLHQMSMACTGGIALTKRSQKHFYFGNLNCTCMCGTACEHMLTCCQLKATSSAAASRSLTLQV